jgi:hypothetical protein
MFDISWSINFVVVSALCWLTFDVLMNKYWSFEFIIVMNIKLNLTILLNSHYNLVFGAQYFILESIVK